MRPRMSCDPASATALCAEHSGDGAAIQSIRLRFQKRFRDGNPVPFGATTQFTQIIQ